MRINKYNWDNQQTEKVTVPNAPIEEFVNWFLNSRAWEDDLDAIHLKVRKLKRKLAEPVTAKNAKITVS